MSNKTDRQMDYVLMAPVVVASLAAAIGGAAVDVALLTIGLALGLGMSLGWLLGGALHSQRLKWSPPSPTRKHTCLRSPSCTAPGQRQ